MEKYLEWDPISHINDLFIWNIESGANTSKIILKQFGESSKLLEIEFIEVMSFRLTQETARSKSSYENKSFNGFKIVEDSKYLRWLQEESFKIFDDWPLTHYLICTVDCVIDIITTKQPVMQWITE